MSGVLGCTGCAALCEFCEPDPEERETWQRYCSCYHVRTLTGREVEIDAAPSDSVAAFKEKIHDRSGIPVARMQLLHGEIEMDDHLTLESYAVEKPTELKLILKELPRGEWEGLDGIARAFNLSLSLIRARA